MISKLEYIWLDGYTPEPNIRSKTKIYQSEQEPTLDDLPIWSFDGSSTKQAEGNYSDCMLKPVKMIKDPQRKSAYLVLCEVLNPDLTSHPSNKPKIKRPNRQKQHILKQKQQVKRLKKCKKCIQHHQRLPGNTNKFKE